MRHDAPPGSQAAKQRAARGKKASISATSSTMAAMADRSGGGRSSALPPAVRVRLYELFVQIEREFEALYAENMAMQERLERAERGSGRGASQIERTTHVTDHHQLEEAHAATSTSSTHKGTTSKTMYAHKLRSHTNRLRAQTNRFVANLKGQGLNCSAVRRYTGHKDGIWEVSVSRMGLPILGTASADHTAMIWGMHSGQALLQYAGHSGSVNSLRFHPSKELVLTASGDGSAHIWQCAVHLYDESSSGRVASSEDELEPGDKDAANMASLGFSSGVDEDSQFSVLRTPLRALTGHSGVVIAADWLPGGQQAVTAGWDRQACIWDTQTGELLHQLSGHDEELTHASAHPTARLVVTSSKDSTFRLWDFREAIHSVSVFQVSLIFHQ